MSLNAADPLATAQGIARRELGLNGVFAMAEIALVSAKRARLQQRAEAGHGGAALALRLSQNPERFLSTVLIGITLVGVLAGAFGGASLSGYVVPFFNEIPWLAAHSERLAFVLIIRLTPAGKLLEEIFF